MDLNTRLVMLVLSDAISENVASVVRKIIYRLYNNWKISLFEVDGGYIITSLAMILMRSEKAGMNEIPKCESVENIKKSTSFPRAIEITEDCINYVGVNITDTEKEFIQTRLCSVLSDNC